ncbi:MAG: hypothetical protein H8D92_02015 [Pelagibacteraceae bacterium]|nr:hypothetical protein [Pelagibacteraceae bacterium]
MGTKIKAKFEGSCKLCGETWAIGDTICYQKTPKAICSAEECFKGQGGTISSYSGGAGFSRGSDVIITKIPDVEVGDSTKQVAEVLQQYIVVAHHLTKSLYPELDVNTHVFGQIRSKIIDQLLYCTDIQKQ